MDVSSIAALATEMSAARTQQAISMSVLKMAMDQQGSAALALLQASAESSAQAASAIEGLGENIDVFV
ncbi:MAG TPA: YjfB family protein [Rhodocyclaceae bacterium]|nr:YjfB family protein [Rhodocyclaceae bacterium]